MRIVYCIILFLAAGMWSAPAQTNTGTNAVDAILALVTTNAPMTATNPPAPTKPAIPRPQGPIKIHSDGMADFDLNGHWATYTDHVIVTDPQMKLTCEWLRSNLPMKSGERITNIVAQTNVVIDFTDDKGQQTHVTGDEGVYFLFVEDGVTNETVTLTGNPPEIRQGQNTMIGDAIIWNRMTGHVTVTNPRGVLWPETNSPAAADLLPMAATATNVPTTETNPPPVTNNSK